MSWSVAAMGKAPAVGAEIEKQFANGSICSEPEEAIRQSARAVIAAAIAGQDKATAIQVSANGSQSQDYQTKAARNSLSISVQPMGSFLE